MRAATMSLWRSAIAAAVIVMIGGAYLAGHRIATMAADRRLAIYQQGVAESDRRAVEAQWRRERAQSAAFDAVTNQFEEDTHHAKAEADRVIADLRTGALRLRERWSTQVLACDAGIAAGAAKPDATADDRAASAGRIVRAAAECDAQVRGLQSILMKERE